MVGRVNGSLFNYVFLRRFLLICSAITIAALLVVASLYKVFIAIREWAYGGEASNVSWS